MFFLCYHILSVSQRFFIKKTKKACLLDTSRAQELGIELLEAGDILAEDFPARLVRAIKEHDLVSLKWKKV